MYTGKIFALSAALLAVVGAVPLRHKRDLVVVTKTQEVVVTIPVTRTVWVGAGETSPTDAPATTEQVAPSTSTTSEVAPSTPTTSSTPEAAPTSVVSVPQTSAPAPAPVSTVEAPAVSPISTPTVQSTTSSVVAPAPVPTTSTTSVAPAPAASTPSTTGSTASNVVNGVSQGPAVAGTSYVGDVTYYTPGMGACGIVNTEAQSIVAISESIFDVYTPDGNPNKNPLCGQYVEITGVNGQTYTGQITDRCVGCDAASLDLTETFFNTVTNNGDGRVHNIHWKFASAA